MRPMLIKWFYFFINKIKIYTNNVIFSYFLNNIIFI